MNTTALILGLGTFVGLGTFLLLNKSEASSTPKRTAPVFDTIDMSLLNPEAREAFEEVRQRAFNDGISIRYRSGKRTCAEQNQLYAIGRSTSAPIVTYARGCSSWHVQGRAVDFAVSRAGDVFVPMKNMAEAEAAYAHVGQIMKDLGGKWGGDFPGFPDIGHIEYHPGLTIEMVCPNPAACV